MLNVNQMNTQLYSRLTRCLWFAGSLLVAFARAEPAQKVATNIEPVWIKPLTETQGYSRWKEPRRHYLLPTGACVLLLTNSPTKDDAQRRYDEEVVVLVQQRWFSQLTNFFEHPIYFTGTNLTEFEISFDGSVKRLTCVQKSGSTVMDMTCLSALDSPAPFRRWPGWQTRDKDATRTIRLKFILPENKN